MRKYANARLLSACFLFMLMFALSGCSRFDTSSRPASESPDPLPIERKEKDALFKSGENSPLTPEDQKNFNGLKYYPLNASLRFKTRLHRYTGPTQVRLATNKGEIRNGLRYGYFEFPIGEQLFRLQAYRLEDNASSAPYLFIPFRDATSGKETYGAGRYLDLKENTSGIYDLDFNRAYNPYCAYNKSFVCPIPPAENTLPVPIRAGEKKYSDSH
jgi:uncharacterized protein (DUF1684 family)